MANAQLLNYILSYTPSVRASVLGGGGWPYVIPTPNSGIGCLCCSSMLGGSGGGLGNPTNKRRVGVQVHKYMNTYGHDIHTFMKTNKYILSYTPSVRGVLAN